MEALEEAPLDLESDRGLLTGTATEVELSESGERDVNCCVAGIPPQSQNPPLRGKKISDALLFRGNLVLDCEVPQNLLNRMHKSPGPDRDELTHVRYSAVTCDASQFLKERYTVRPRLFAKPRPIELMIAVTLDNEDEVHLAKTLSGIYQNIAHLESLEDSATWGPGSWKKILVCVISNSRENLDPGTRGLLAVLGVYQSGVAQQSVQGSDVVAHVYEYTTKIIITKGDSAGLDLRDALPCQMLFCLSAKGTTRYQCHRWFFQAFCPVLDPNICLLLDAAIAPGPVSMYKMWLAMDMNSNCGTTIGQKRGHLELINPLKALQHFERNMRSLLGRRFDSLSGFTYDTDDSFCGYRYAALHSDRRGGPLSRYFAPLETRTRQPTNWVSERNLTRLSFEVLTNRNRTWKLKYVPF